MAISNHSDSWIEKKVERLVAAANESLSFKAIQQSNVQILKHYLKMLLTYKEILTDLRAQIKRSAQLSSAFPLLLSIPGVRKLTAATIIGENGDVFRFPTVKQLVAFAGLDPSVYQSGRFATSNNKISKRGSSHLRRALYDYYIKKVAEGKHKNVALIVACHKLLRIIYGV